MDFPDTSFLCSFYRQQVFTPLAFDYMDKLDQPLSVSSLLLFEFHNSLRLQQRLFKNDRTRGFSRNEAEGMFRGLQSDLRTGLLQLVIVDWTDVHGIGRGVERETHFRTRPPLRRHPTCRYRAASWLRGFS